MPTGVAVCAAAGIDASDVARAIAREIQRTMAIDHRRRMFDLQERTRSHERTSVSEWTARSFGARRILSLALTVSVECADAGRDGEGVQCHQSDESRATAEASSPQGAGWYHLNRICSTSGSRNSSSSS